MNKLITIVLLLALYVNAEIIPFDNSAVEKIFQNKQAAVFLFAGDNEQSTAAKAAFTAYDEANPEGVILTISSKDDGHGLFDRLAEYLGVNVNNVPSILYFGENADKYIFAEESVTVENLGDFVTKVKAGEIAQFLKSAAVPESNDEPVKVIVGKTFEEFVTNSEKQVLVKFYAPWCGHCKTLAPHFEEAAQRLSNNPNIVIAKVDSTENEVANLDIQGFPTLKFWGKDKSQPPIDYNGERTADGIVQWLKDHTSFEWVDEVPVVEAEADAEL